MSYEEAKAKYAALGVDTDGAIEKLKTVPLSLHCWQGDDVRGFDTDPSKPLTGGIQTTGSYPGRARTPEELKTMPFGEVWDEYCRSCGVPVDGEWFPVIKKYEAEVTAKRG